MVRQQRLRKWVITYHNYTQESLDNWIALGERCSQDSREEEKQSEVRYLCFGEETGSEGETPHLQAYIELRNKKTLSFLKDLLQAPTLHAEKAKGSAAQNKVYCSKEGICFREYGTPGVQGQGRRRDLESVREMIVSGATELEVANEHFETWTQNHRALNRYRQLLVARCASPNYPVASFPESWREIIWDWTCTQIIWGTSGIGKTEFACAILPGALLVSHLDDLNVFDPNQHTGIIFDDVDIKQRPRTGQIHIVDQTQDRSIHIRYSCAFIPKGTKKIFTTNSEYGECMLISDPAIRRRTQVHHLVAI